MASFNRWVHIFVHSLFFWVSNVYSLPVYIVWMSLLTPVRIWSPALYWRIEQYSFHLLTCAVATWLDKDGYRVIEVGADIIKLANKRALVLANHQSVADTPILFGPFWLKGGPSGAGGRVMWTMWNLMKYSNFGMVSWLRGDFFIESDKGAKTRENELVRLQYHLKNTYLPNRRGWVIVYPEGGFLHKRRESSQRYAKKHGFPHLNHVTLPRVKGIKNILDTIGEPYNPTPDPSTYDPCADLSDNLGDTDMPLQWVIDVTIAYQDAKPPSFIGMAHGMQPKFDTVLHYRAFRVRDIPRDDAGLLEWLAARYVEKDAWLDEYYRTGEVPREGVWDTCGAGVQSYGYQVVNKLVKNPFDKEEVDVHEYEQDSQKTEIKEDVDKIDETHQSEEENSLISDMSESVIRSYDIITKPSDEDVTLSDKSSKSDVGVFKQVDSDKPLLSQKKPTLLRYDLVIHCLCHITMISMAYLQYRCVIAPAFGLLYSVFAAIF